MITNKNIMQIIRLSKILLLLIFSSIIAQLNSNNTRVHETRTFTKNLISVIQSQYLGADGFPSHEVFLKLNGLFPTNLKVQSTPFFVISVSKDVVSEKNGKLNISESAKFLNLDFFIKTVTNYNSANEAVPIWDGRVYEENNKLIVGGYSSKFYERPVGFIDEIGRFVATLTSKDSKNFSLLQLPTNNIIFDPYEWKLIRLRATKDKIIEKVEDKYLPINLFGQQGKPIYNATFDIDIVSENSVLVLNVRINDQKIELARCDVRDSRIIDYIEGYQPKLIQGASQPENGNVVTMTFEGEYSDNITFNGSEILLKNDSGQLVGNVDKKNNEIIVDGDFADWRNIKGVSDIKGDFVSYLYNNPDTDLLEFKVTNDDKYLYLYSRVDGAHGRTGNKGRYYWYAYIDVDTDPNTGYAPTRDDNCYFGISIGDDCEAQFEFIGNHFVKTFFGFTGIGAEKEVLSGKLELGPSYYSSTARDGTKRNKYKVEYVNREGSRFITHDYTEGTSEDIIIALSPDGSEVEAKVVLESFLKDKSENWLMKGGQKIDIALGVEGSSDHYGSDKWGADSSPVIYGYYIK